VSTNGWFKKPELCNVQPVVRNILCNLPYSNGYNGRLYSHVSSNVHMYSMAFLYFTSLIPNHSASGSIMVKAISFSVFSSRGS
jgi:hypothetical protein